MKHLVWILVALLLLAHHDFWFWNDDRLVFGFLPIGMFYHIIISLAAAGIWFFAATFAWPKELDEESESGFSSQLTMAEDGGTLRNDQTIVDEPITVRMENPLRAADDSESNEETS